MEQQHSPTAERARGRAHSGSSEASGTSEEVELPEGRTLPLTSARVTLVYLRRLAQALALPTRGTKTEVLTAIEGKIGQEHEVQNVQVIVQETDPGEALFLVDDQGVFLEVEAVAKEPARTARGEQAEHEHTIESLRQKNESLTQALQEQDATIAELRQEVEHLSASDAAAEVETLRSQLKKEKERAKKLWSLSCKRAMEQEEQLVAKELEVEDLRARLEKSARRVDRSSHTGRDSQLGRGDSLGGDQHLGDDSRRGGDSSLEGEEEGGFCSPEASHRSVHPVERVAPRKGRAPPIDPYTGENPEIRFDDWLPSLTRAASWNNWTEDEKLIQLAGHLRGRALQEWNLMEETERSSWKDALTVLRGRLDQGTKVLATQDFRHTVQRESEKVTDFVRRLERVFHIAYGRDAMLKETRQSFLYGQLQEGLRYDLMQSPAVSGALTYPELTMAAKNEEQRQAELKKRRSYHTGLKPRVAKEGGVGRPSETFSPTSKDAADKRLCYKCGKPGHIAKNCRANKSESKGGGGKRDHNKQPITRQIQAEDTLEPESDELPDLPDLPLTYLFSSEGEDSVKLVHVQDKGSHSQLAKVTIQGFPTEGIVDSGADITIMNGDLFKKIATAAQLRKKDFKLADKSPRAYNQQPFSLDGRIDLEITFGERAMVTPVYIMMKAHDPLLLSEGVCRQLGIISYHSEVEGSSTQGPSKKAVVPRVKVQLIRSIRILPQQGIQVEVRMDKMLEAEAMLLEPDPELEKLGVYVQESVLQTGMETVQLVVTNPTGTTQHLEEGAVVGTAEGVTIVPTESNPLEAGSLGVRSLSTNGQEATHRKEKVKELFAGVNHLSESQKKEFLESLAGKHEVFALDEGEKGDTSLVQMEVDTGEATPRKQRPYRLPFAARQEVAQQLKKMEEAGVIQPSKSPWASPIVLVRKKDGSHRFCVDYRNLNAVTTPDTFPLPRIDDLLDQLGNAKYFSTLDLAAGYWQIQMHPKSQQKTAFVTHMGLHEFRVMPFGLRNAPAVFQRLMQQVLAGLKTADGSDFTAVYIDDVLVFSSTLEDHIQHLERVIERLLEAGLKLRPHKCQFIQQEVHYLGYVLTPHGLKTSEEHVRAVAEFPVPKDVRGVRQFLGLASYYRRFIPSFARVAHPLHALTRKSVLFDWNQDCQESFESLQRLLTTAPVLAFPNFNQGFVLETDASGLGLGSVLSQKQPDGKLHPVAFASRALSPCERNYSITELETLAVVWSVSHFRTYLYGQEVVIYTDHSAVSAVLGNPCNSGKHARWWMRVHGGGMKSMEIRHRPGRENVNADALSRSPVSSTMSDDPGTATIMHVQSETVSDLLGVTPDALPPVQPDVLVSEQRKDPKLQAMIQYLTDGSLPEDERLSQRLIRQASLFTLTDGLLYFTGPQGSKRAVLPEALREIVMKSVHGGPFAGHFSRDRLYKTLVRSWYWEGMYTDCEKHRKGCPQCCIVAGGGRRGNPPLQPIPVSRPFQILGVDVMDLPKTERGNKHVLVMQDFLTKWPWVFPLPDQKTTRIVEALVEQIIPMCGVPEALLSDRGTNLLSFLMRDVCSCLGIEKLNTTAYHPQCDGLTERFNRTLKTMLRKHADLYGLQWDRYLHGVVWAYRNTPHESTSEKPSLLLFGRDCRYPAEAAFLPATELEPADVTDYRAELILTLTRARDLAAKSVQKAQSKYKRQYDKTKKCVPGKHDVGGWVLIRFPQDEAGGLRKLSRPWHGPYRVTEVTATGITAERVYTSDRNPIHVHLSRVSKCPPNFPAGYFWYGDRRNGPGRPPKWIDTLVQTSEASGEEADKTEPEFTEADGVVPESESVEAEPESKPTEAAATPAAPFTRTKTRVIAPPDRYQ